MVDTSKEDSDLVGRCLRNDERAYRQLLDRYRRPVYAIVRRMVRDDEEARDLAQEAFIRAFRNLHTFDRSRSFANWLFRIATNLCIDHHRKRRIQTVPLVHADPEGGEDRTLDLPDPGPSPAETFSTGERGRRLSAVIDTLPPVYRGVIQLRHIQGLSYDEIAEILELPLGTVKARIHRAHRLLREKLTRQGFDWAP